jgi:hypothetical protein
MSGNRELQAADISPPTEFDADIPGPSGVYSRAIAATAQRYQIPEAAKGNFWTMKFSADCQIAFGDADVAVNLNEDSGLASEVLTPDTNTGELCFAGETVHWRLPKHKSLTHFSIIGPVATGRWSARTSNNIIVDD